MGFLGCLYALPSLTNVPCITNHLMSTGMLHEAARLMPRTLSWGLLEHYDKSTYRHPLRRERCCIDAPKLNDMVLQPSPMILSDLLVYVIAYHTVSDVICTALSK